MIRYETESFKKYIEKAKPIILELLEEHDFLSQRSLQILMEQNNFWHVVTWNAIRELKIENKLRTAKYPPRGNFPMWIYRFDLRLSDIKDKIDREYKPLYKKFMKLSPQMGTYAEEIIEKALTRAGYITLSHHEHTRYFRGRVYPRKNDLDFIAYREGVFYGIEVKNTLPYPNWEEDIISKKLVADYHGIQFVMISRELGPYAYDLFQCGGLHIEFKRLIWSPNFSSLAKRIEEKLYFPINCISEPDEDLIRKLDEIHFLHNKHFYGKGRI